MKQLLLEIKKSTLIALNTFADVDTCLENKKQLIIKRYIKEIETPLANFCCIDNTQPISALDNREIRFSYNFSIYFDITSLYRFVNEVNQSQNFHHLEIIHSINKEGKFVAYTLDIIKVSLYSYSLRKTILEKFKEILSSNNEKLFKYQLSMSKKEYEVEFNNYSKIAEKLNRAYESFAEYFEGLASTYFGEFGTRLNYTTNDEFKENFTFEVIVSNFSEEQLKELIIDGYTITSKEITNCLTCLSFVNNGYASHLFEIFSLVASEWNRDYEIKLVNQFMSVSIY